MKLWVVLASLVTLNLISNLVNTVTFFAIPERDVLLSLTSARACHA